VTGVDLSPEMLERASEELSTYRSNADIELMQGCLTDLPVPDAWADLTISGLAVGHVEDLASALAEMSRVTRPGGVVVCSDVHPIGHALGWLRDFKHDGERYAVRHIPHLYSRWHTACATAGLAIEQVLEPMLDHADIPSGAHFDRAALEVPVALVFQLRRIP
jgi:malonyl-CoA O-methyltransferase